MSRLRLPPPSEPPDRPTAQHWSRAGKNDRCEHCSHDWHGLFCRVGACGCQSSCDFKEEE